jgi:hypothetical protein
MRFYRARIQKKVVLAKKLKPLLGKYKQISICSNSFLQV